MDRGGRQWRAAAAGVFGWLLGTVIGLVVDVVGLFASGSHTGSDADLTWWMAAPPAVVGVVGAVVLAAQSWEATGRNAYVAVDPAIDPADPDGPIAT